MPFRKYASAPLNLHFRNELHRLARKFVWSEASAARIVERTINVLCDNPNLLDGPDIKEAVYALLRRHAFDENDLTDSWKPEQDFIPTAENAETPRRELEAGRSMLRSKRGNERIRANKHTACKL